MTRHRHLLSERTLTSMEDCYAPLFAQLAAVFGRLRAGEIILRALVGIR